MLLSLNSRGYTITTLQGQDWKSHIVAMLDRAVGHMAVIRPPSDSVQSLVTVYTVLAVPNPR